MTTWQPVPKPSDYKTLPAAELLAQGLQWVERSAVLALEDTFIEDETVALDYADDVTQELNRLRDTALQSRNIAEAALAAQIGKALIDAAQVKRYLSNNTF